MAYSQRQFFLTKLGLKWRPLLNHSHLWSPTSNHLSLSSRAGLFWVQNVNFDVQKSLTCCVLGWGKGSDVMKLLLCLISKTSNCCPGVNDLSKIFVSLAVCLNVFVWGAMHRSVSRKVKQIWLFDILENFWFPFLKSNYSSWFTLRKSLFLEIFFDLSLVNLHEIVQDL